MEWKSWGVKGGVALVLMAAMVGCAPIQPVTPSVADVTPDAAAEATAEPIEAEATVEPAEQGATTEVATYDEPFAYCAAVGTVDTPDARYTGEELPDIIAEGLRDAYNTPDTPLEVYQRASFWRCMDGSVYACNIGANLPCLSKADESTAPSQPILDFCKENADSDYIPAYVTGRATVYNWGCEDGEPVVVEQMTDVDSQGYLEFVWHKLTSPE